MNVLSIGPLTLVGLSPLLRADNWSFRELAKVNVGNKVKWY